MKLLTAFAHLFIPRHTNNHKAKILHPLSLLIISFTLIMYQVVINYYFPKTQIKILGYASNISVDEVVALTNVKRVENGLTALQVNPELSDAARRKASDMIARDYWAHAAPDGTQPWKFFSDAGYRYKYAGENLARDFSNAGSAVDAWMASSSHKENMLSDKYTEIGIAVTEGDLNGVDTTIIVQLFGSKFESVAQIPPKPATAGTQVNPTIVPTQVPQSTLTASALPESAPQATPVVTNTPTPQPVFIGNPPIAEVESNTSQATVLISPFTVTKNLSLVVIGILLLVLLVDVIVISRRRIARISGRTLAHLSYLGIILIIAIILSAGRIL